MNNPTIEKSNPSVDTDLFKQAILIRSVEEKLLELFAQGQLNGTVHTCIGQEFSALAFAGQLDKNDTVFSNHRCHGHFLAFTKDYKGLLAELMGKASGVCGGIGGSQHLCKDNFYSNGIQGGIVPVAAGIALAEHYKQSQNIVLVYIGDGMLGEGAVYESLNIISKWNLPILVVCENNYYAQSTAQSTNLAGDILKRADAFGIQTVHNNIWNTEELMTAAQQSIDIVRRERKPVFHLVDMYRLAPHSKGDDDRDPAEIERYKKQDPLYQFSLNEPQEYQTLLSDVQNQINHSVEQIVQEESLSLKEYFTENNKSEAKQWQRIEPIQKRQVELINEFFKTHLAEDKQSVFIGEDVLSPYGGAFKVARDLSDLFPEQVKSTPISEGAIVGIGNGLALKGYRPFIEIMFGDFVTLCMDQLANHAAKFHHMYNKQVNCPLVLRTPMGGRRGYGPTHSQTYDRFVVGLTNTTTIALSSLVDPRRIYQTICEREQQPVIVLENKLDYGRKIATQQVPHYKFEHNDEPYPVVRIAPERAEGEVTIVCYGGMVNTVLDCLIPLFQEDEILAEVIVLTKISPIDYNVIVESVGRTQKLCVVEEGTKFCGLGSEIIASVHELCDQKIQSQRVASLPVPIPSAKSLEQEVLPNQQHIIEAIQNVCI